MTAQALLALLAWMISFGVIWELATIAYKFWRAVNNRRLIPCDRCIYATHSPRLNQLQCAVHPEFAYSERAIACRDFCAQSPHPQP